MGEKKEEQYMSKKKTVIVLLLLALMILTVAPTSFAQRQYLANLTEVYGTGSCDICHNNGSADGLRTSYGMLFENQSNHSANASAALRAIGAPPQSTAITPTATSTVAEPVTTEIIDETPTQENIPEDAQIPEDEENPETNPQATGGAKGSPGFGFVASLVGLFAWALLTKRNNK
jgi:hypothetical protein